MGLNPVVIHARMDLLEQAGYDTFPDTWDKFVEASLKLNKPPFYAYGMALGTYARLQRQHRATSSWPACGRHGAAPRQGQPGRSVNSPGSRAGPSS